jgi:hypothetical protein
MTDDSEVARIAKGLTKAQRVALLAIDRPYFRTRWSNDRFNLKRITVGDRVIASATMAALMDVELAWAFGVHVGFLPRGKQVRAYLQSKGGEA